MIEKIKKAFRFGDPTNAEYLKEIERLRMQQEAQIAYQKAEEQKYQRSLQNSITSTYPYLAQYNAAQQQERYNQGAMSGAVLQPKEKLLIDSLADTNEAMKRLAVRVEKQERRIDMLSGFYTWITDVHPEIAAQHKAMQELYEAANAPQEKGMAS